MKIINSFISAFSMYSRIPMPQIEWKEENRRYALCFFPLIGAVIAVLEYLWWKLAFAFSFADIFYGAVAAVIPVFITGGIHLDGFCDVSDANAACADREKSLEIMKDSNIGAFAAIELCIYFLLTAAGFVQIKESHAYMMIIPVCIGFVQSRALSGLAAVTFRNARAEGTLQSFSRPAHKKITVAVQIIWLCICFAADVYFTGLAFGGVVFLAGMLCFLYYRIFSYKKYGGITGDMAGWFLQLCELIMLLAAAADVRIMHRILMLSAGG